MCEKRSIIKNDIKSHDMFFLGVVHVLKVIVMLHFCVDPSPEKGKVEQEKSDLPKTPEERQPSQQVMMSRFLS